MYQQQFSTNTLKITSKIHEDLERLKSFSALLESLPIFRDYVLDKEYSKNQLTELQVICDSFCHKFQRIIVLAIGGSSGAGKALTQMFQDYRSDSYPEITFIDNIDPVRFSYLISTTDITRTGVIVISKSGATAETLCQMLLCFDFWRGHLPLEILKEHFLIITTPDNNPLHRLSQLYDLPLLPHHPEVGGRFACFTNVGALPALLQGIDFSALLQGARQILKDVLSWLSQSLPKLAFSASISDAIEAMPPALSGALVQVALARLSHVNMHVIMPYHDNWSGFIEWYRQLSAESIGKEGHGITPVASIGVTDQHSQLQLFLDGPKDKLITLLQCNYVGALPEKALSNQPIPQPPPQLIPEKKIPDLQYLYNRSMVDLIKAEQEATYESLIQKECWARRITYDRVSPEVVGALMAHFMIETLAIAHLWQINAFDQPAVEFSKKRTRELLFAI